MLEIIQNIKQKLEKLFFFLFYRNSFKSFGAKSTISAPFKVNGARFVQIGRQTYINEGAWLLALQIDQNNPVLKIGNKSYVGRNVHVVSVKEVVIENDVLISDKVYISDNLHEYKNVELPIKEQEIIVKKKCRIGAHTWLGENVCVIGCTVGKHCVIGANSVVLSDIPDYCVAVGAPAKVIKRYNQVSRKWEKVSEE